MKKLSLLFLFCFIQLSIHAQNTDDALWTKSSNLKSASIDVLKRESKPSRFELYNLNLALLKEKLKNAPSRGDSFGRSNVIISFPNNKGMLENFQIMEASVMEPELQKKYPDIHSYIGKGIDNPGEIIRFSVTPLGLNCLHLSNTESTVLIDPYTKDRLSYMVYAQKDLPTLQTSLENDVIDLCPDKNQNSLKSAQTAGLSPNDGKLRTFRLALATTGEYSQSILTIQGISDNTADDVKKATVLAQLNKLMTSVNAIFERDICLTFKLVANNSSLIFLDPGTDNYTDFDQNKLLIENQVNCEKLIGTSNYDIGHVINASDYGGLAGWGVICIPTAKAMGRSGGYYPTIIHEMGHQLGTGHTDNRWNFYGDPTSAVELGCGSNVHSIMSGASSELFFHSVSIQEIWKYINGNSQCAVLTETGNIAPIISAGNDVSIPKSTPFVLEGQGTDTNGNLTFSWEQMDSEKALCPPVSQAVGGPAFKWLTPSTSPIRYLPELNTVISGNLISETEAIPSVSRKLNFNFVVRDNELNGGQVAIDKKVITVDGNSGPFIVTSHKTPEIWHAGTTKTITWEVAGTNGGDINTQLVDILFSKDGGYTYPTKLATNVPNDGSQDIVVPFGVKTTNGRYMIRAVDNIYFAINSANLTIEESDFLMNFSEASTDVCLPATSVTYDFTYNTYMGYTGTTTFSANSPTGTSITFSPASASTDGVPVKMTVSGITSSNLGENTITVDGTSNGTPSIAITKNVFLNVYNSIPIPLALVSPSNDAVNVSPSVLFTWNADINAKSYIIEIATDITFTTVIETAHATANSYRSTLLKINTTYYWHVQSINPCIDATFSSIYHFKSYDLSLLTYIPDDNFQKTLKKLGLDTENIDNYIITSSIKDITSLNIASQNICDLTGIQDFTGLTSLNCGENQLTILDVTKNTALTELYCYTNKLSNLDVSNNINLKYLYCGVNQLTNLDVTKNLDLLNLDFTLNKLKSIDITKNIKLFSLSFNVNNVLSLDVSKNSELVALACNYNMISSLDLSKNLILQNIDCANNQLVYLNLRNGANNILAYATLHSNPDLSCIQVDNASLSMHYQNWLKDDAAYYSEDCHYTYDPIMSDSLTLVALYNQCDGSNWAKKNNWLSGPFDTWEGVINQRGRVTYLSLGDYYNSVGLKGPLPSELSNLTWLYGIGLSNNKLTGTLPPSWSKFTKLDWISLGSNQLTGSLPESWSDLLNLRDVSLENNQLSGSLPESWTKLIKLEKLFLYNNQLTELPNLSPLTNLSYVMVQGNFLDFGDIEPNIRVPKSYFIYSPQAPVGVAYTIVKNQDEEFRISVTVGGKSNKYQWTKNGVNISGATVAEYVIPSVIPRDAGVYVCKITNTVATELIMTNQPITLEVISRLASNAGPDQSVYESATVTLDGSSSSASEDKTLTYKWAAPEGITLNSTTIVNPTFTAPEVNAETAFTFFLVVNDGGIDSPADKVVITVKDFNNRPIANAGYDKSVCEGTFASLDGSASLDQFRNMLTYKWIAPAGIILSSTTAATPTFTTPEVTANTIYTISLVVNNGNVDSPADDVQITVLKCSNKIQQDSLALVALYNATDGSKWTKKGNWLTNAVKTWEGVTVENGRVVGLNLASWTSVGLVGTLPTELSNLTAIRSIYLSNNQLSGLLPESWSALVNLQQLDLSSNKFSGTLPEIWSALLNLNSLVFSGNQLTGTLPESWSALTNIQVLYLGSNQLSGSLPASWSALDNIQQLDISYNKFSGTLPESWSALFNLHSLVLSGNQLTGTLPASWSSLINLQSLQLSNNQLSGILPTSWSSLANLYLLILSGNQLTGTLPVSWSDLTNMQVLYLGNNQLSGSLPASWSALMNLQQLSLGFNQLSGPLPDSWSRLFNLQYLELSYNQINGAIPLAWLSLINLRYLYLYYNQLTGLPDLSSFTNLSYLMVQNNLFDFGDIEPNIGVPNDYFSYSPQALIGVVSTITKNLGQEFRISVTVGGSSNMYQWYKNGVSIMGATGTEYVIPSVTSGDAGNYTCQIINTVATELTLTSQPITLQIANQAPNANAGIDQSTNEGAIVTLDGSASSDAEGDPLTYQWTAPAGITLSSLTAAKPTFTAPEVDTDTDYAFSLVTNDGTLASAADQVIVTVKNVSTKQQIALNAGWNIISSRVVPTNLNLKPIFQPLIDAGKLKKVMDETGKTIENFGGFGGWVNNIGNLVSTEGFKVNVTAASTLSFEGTSVQLPFDINLNTGWNIISFPSTSLQDAKALFQPLIDAGKLKKVMDETGKTIENFGAFGEWKNNIGNLLPGKGYKVSVTSNCILTIPVTGTKSAVILPELQASEHFKPVFTGNGTDHTNINLVDLQASGLQAGDEIGVFDGKLCVGSATLGTEQLMTGSISIPASSNDELEKTVNGFTSGHSIELQLYRDGQTSVLKPAKISGNELFEKNGSLFAKVNTKNLTDMQITDVTAQFKCFPNPFTREINIEVQNLKKAEVTVEIYNMTGQLVKNLFKGTNNSHLILKWNGTNVSGQQVVPGVYLCKVNGMVKQVVFEGNGKK